ncbi:hypothetical protein DAEQUDRAFT_315246 [Daedalea quercina L-15889]|uniref:Uncharacterized protein n=1 Tax=Daedalea quercina L-15889 TaxID=1314783 RepID=A0A165PVT3_9APHY|nr:hypothetical protein DAEQUDRAFT_315246 [Daedalea quercina L-15889]
MELQCSRAFDYSLRTWFSLIITLGTVRLNRRSSRPLYVFFCLLPVGDNRSARVLEVRVREDLCLCLFRYAEEQRPMRLCGRLKWTTFNHSCGVSLARRTREKHALTKLWFICFLYTVTTRMVAQCQGYASRWATVTSVEKIRLSPCLSCLPAHSLELQWSARKQETALVNTPESEGFRSAELWDAARHVPALLTQR